MSGAFLALCLASSVQQVDVADRRDLALLILTPFGSSSKSGTSQLVAAAAAAFERDTDLRVLPADQAGIPVDAMLACGAERRLTCWVRHGRQARVDLLLIVTVARAESADHAAMTMLDLAELGGLSEAEIFEKIISIPPRIIDDPQDTFARAIAGDFRGFFEKRRHFRSYGAALVEVDCESCSLLLGEKVVVVESDRLELLRLRPGAFEVALTRGGEIVCRDRVEIVTGQTTSATCEAPPLRSNNPPLLYAGIAGATLGLASIVLSTGILAGGPSQVCFGRDEGDCAYVRTARSGFGADRITPIESSNNGVPLMPAGVGLFVLGGVWTAGGAAFDDRYTYWALAAGVVLGGAAAAATFAFE